MKNRTTICDPAIFLLGVYLKNTETLTCKDICIPSQIYNSQDMEAT